jgi:hypothetical protein
MPIRPVLHHPRPPPLNRAQQREAMRQFVPIIQQQIFRERQAAPPPRRNPFRPLSLYLERAARQIARLVRRYFR